ncbi:hypothetical protein [Paenibacillus silvae]|uniref:Uncharacterized protein n=1 Tax=Paenibacillus silvae TaxID=1325358 RepID=A0A2W6PC28_9BACL|nr:hypothetical protein [Paenibacillus silvae]PZT55626.1 hypothetical protein DN757_11115 [Paenibacillus silvae]
MGTELIENEQLLSKLTDLTELYELLNRLEIKYIFSYDDEWNIEGLQEKEEERKRELLELDYLEFVQQFEIEVLDNEHRYISNEGLNIVKEINESEAFELTRLKQLMLSSIERQRSDLPLKVLKELLDSIKVKGDIEVNTISDRFKIEDVQDINGRILFLLDMNMGELADKDVVISTILDIKKSRINKNDIAIVYSHEKLEMYEKHDNKVKYVEKYLKENNPDIGKLVDTEMYTHLLPFQLWAISKGHAHDKIIPLLVSTLEKATFGYSLHDYLETKRYIIDQATRDLIKLSEETYEVLYNDSFIEGEVFFDILERTHQSIINKVEYETFKENPSVLENLLIVTNNKSKKIKSEITSGIKKFRLKNAEKKITPEIFKGIAEYGLINYNINFSYNDITTGDLFMLKTFNPESEKYAILVTPDCDLPIRPKKNEVTDCSRNAKIATLLLCDSIEFGDDAKFKTILEKGDGLWPIKHNNKYLLLIPDTKNELFITDSRILDLCSLNRDGYANLSVDREVVRNFKSFYFNDYYERNLSLWLKETLDINSYIPSHVNLDVKLSDSSQVEDDKKVDLLKLIAGLKYSLNFDLSNNKFDMQRVGRLETRRTLQLIQTKINHMSRIGLNSIPGA